MSAEVKSYGVSLSTVLFVVFLVLKLCNVIDWSWWWVTAPLWIPAGLAIGILLIFLLIAIIVGVVTVYKKW